MTQVSRGRFTKGVEDWPPEFSPVPRMSFPAPACGQPDDPRGFLNLAGLGQAGGARLPVSRGIPAVDRLRILKTAVSAGDDPRDFMDPVHPPAAEAATSCILRAGNPAISRKSGWISHGPRNIPGSGQQEQQEFLDVSASGCCRSWRRDRWRIPRPGSNSPLRPRHQASPVARILILSMCAVPSTAGFALLM